MIAFPNCKINLGLHILDKREDGYHNLQTVFFPIPWNDAIEIITDSSTTDISIITSGNNIEGPSNNNLCVKAYHLLKKDFPELPGIQLYLHKTIPTGAGMGGGSADGAFTLSLLNKKYDLGISEEKLIEYALQLGSDCPFFIINKPCFASGRGEIMTPLPLSLKGYYIQVVHPGIHVNTGWAFSQLDPDRIHEHSLREAIVRPIQTWKETITNDFEKPVFSQYPEIAAIKENLYTLGAVYAAMSGSGSTVFGIFEQEHNTGTNLFNKYNYRSYLL